ncbi:MAG: 30S ribosomal protein S17 [Dictyoglomaceae bacterium]|nr:30S ribosomal protein S17 [Dictyoglomaceae bacterium]
MTGKRKEMVGRVISAKMQKTIVVLVETTFSHPLYKKTIKKLKKYKVHDEKQEAKEGDLVLIQETRPLSKEKRWRLVKILRKGESLPTIEEVMEEGGINDSTSN